MARAEPMETSRERGKIKQSIKGHKQMSGQQEIKLEPKPQSKTRTKTKTTEVKAEASR